jgi:NTE family protein
LLHTPTLDPGRDPAREDFSAVRETIARSYESVVLVLQGGGALGSFQPGVVEALDEVGIDVHWIAGISIGAINAALIAGNPPGRRMQQMRGFWEKVTSRVKWPWVPPGEPARAALNQLSSHTAMMFGQPGFFSPRFPPPQWLLPGGPEATSYYDTAPLKATLEEFVDFAYLNRGAIRFSVGAVNVRSGNFVYFDSTQRRIRPEHIMASAALPPGFPAVEIDGEQYWDGGLVSNTPLTYVLSNVDGANTLIFQVDLFAAQGARPRTLAEVQERQKDIQFSSRTRLNTDVFRMLQDTRRTVAKLLDQLPPELRNSPDAKKLESCRRTSQVNIMHLIYRRKQYDRDFKDYEFSRNTMLDHWKAGTDTIVRTLRHAEWFELPDPDIGVVTHDIHRDADD